MAGEISTTSKLSGWRDQIVGFIRGSMCGLNAPDNTLSDVAVGAWSFCKKRNELLRAAMQGNWGTAKTILDALGDHPEMDRRVVEVHYETAVFSIGKGKQTLSFVEKLVGYLRDDDRWLTYSRNGDGITVLHVAAAVDNTAAAMLLVDRMPDLIHAVDNNGDYPAHRAARFRCREVLQYLMPITDWDIDENGVGATPAADRRQLLLLLYVIEAKFFDIGLDLLNKYPRIAITKVVHNGRNRTALSLLAEMRFRTASSGLFHWCMLILRKLSLSIFCQVKSKNKYMSKRQHAAELLKCLCKAMESLSQEEDGPIDIYADAILKAARRDNREVVREIFETFPRALSCAEPVTGLNIFHLAIKNRCRRVFGLIYETGLYKHLSNLEMQDASGNNMLHVVAKLPPAHILANISGPAFQMQREVQWFQAVSKVSIPKLILQENNAGMTPLMLFTGEHIKLREEGEKWMKDRAKSCSIVAVLIITIMFAAAITVPGGSDSRTGFPNLGRDKAFKVFAIANIISLMTSTTSLLKFLSILNSGFLERSFLSFHSAQLILGLGSLYISIASMLVAFVSTIFLVLGNNKNIWFLVPASVVAFLAIAPFGFVQLYLLGELILLSDSNRILKGRVTSKPLVLLRIIIWILFI